MARIDVHHHFLPPAYRAALSERAITDSAGWQIPQWNVQDTLEMMERNGISTAILSISEPGVYFGDEALARNLARSCNEYAAELLHDSPRSFGAFAILPLPNVEDALYEMEYALDTLHLDGVVLLSSVNGLYPGDTGFDDLFSELNRRKTVVFLHPAVPAINATLQLKLPPFLLEFPFDTTRAAVNLIYSGTLEHCPDLRFILAHGGGTIPYLTMRIMTGQIRLQNLAQSPLVYLKQFYYDTALSTSPFALRSLSELVDPSHMLFGSDYPFVPELVASVMINGIEAFDRFDEQAKRMVEGESALALFPRFGGV